MGWCAGVLRGIHGLKNVSAILSGTAGYCCIDACAVQPRWMCSSTSFTDYFRWMESAKRPGFRKHLQRKEYRTREHMRPLQSLQKALLQEALASLHPEQSQSPEPSGSYEYWTKRCVDAPKPVLLRRALRSSSRPEVLLDANEDPELDDVECWGQVKISPNGRRIAFTVPAVRGAASARAVVREIPTASCGLAGMWDLAELPEVVALEWLGDQYLVYTVADASQRPHKVLRHPVVGSGGTKEIFVEPDPARFVSLGTTKDGALVTINSNTKTSSEVHILLPGSPAALPRCIAHAQPGLEYYVEHYQSKGRPPAPAPSSKDPRSSPSSVRHVDPVLAILSQPGGYLMLLTNSGSSNGELRLMTTGLDQPERAWQLLYEPPTGTTISDMDMFADYCVLYERRHGRPAASIVALKNDLQEEDEDADTEEHVADSSRCVPSLALGMPDGFMCEPTSTPTEGSIVSDRPRPGVTPLQLPAWATCVAPGLNGDPNASSVRLVLSSPIEPETHVDFRLDGDGVGELVHRDELPDESTHFPHDYLTRHLHATSADGVEVPVTVVHPVHRVPGAPLLLTAYGAYGECLDPGMDASLLPLLRRGWTLAFAHVRGGGEGGRRWHLAATGANKYRSVDDLEGCLDFLLSEGYGCRGRVAVEGTSAGALLAAALMMRRGQDVGAALLRSPFLDLLGTTADPLAPLVAHEVSEWGDIAGDATCRRAATLLCPLQSALRMLQRIAGTQGPAPKLPPVLATVALDDDRVPPWAAAKFIAALQALEQWGRPMIATRNHLRTSSFWLLPRQSGGHFGHEQQYYEDRAEEYAFLVSACERAV